LLTAEIVGKQTGSWINEINRKILKKGGGFGRKKWQTGSYESEILISTVER
jgi:hypothetical protein